MPTTTTQDKEKEKEKIYPSYTELRIYPSFTEIREKFDAPQNFKMFFPREVFDQILVGSLSLEGIAVLSQNAVTKKNNLENEIVFLRRRGEETIRCQVIRSNDLLLKDLQTGRFIRAQEDQLEYLQIPEEEGTEVTFALKHGGDSILSYLIRGIIWSPRYNLKIRGDEIEFEGWADMTNKTRRDYKIKRTELFAGDVQLEERNDQRSSLTIERRCCCCCSTDSSVVPPRIGNENELSGMYWYPIDQSFVLLQQSTFSLPFLQVNLKVEKFSGLQNSFQETNQKGKFQRKYRIESDRFLPRGLITIREDQRIVGQMQFNDLCQGERRILDCGNDPDVTFQRQIKVLAQKRHSAQYEIHLTIHNGKTRSIKYEYQEMISATKFEIIRKNGNEISDQLIEILPQGLQIEQENLQANAEDNFLYQIHFEYRNGNDQND